MNSIYNKGVIRLMFALGSMALSLSACSTDDVLDDNDEPKAVKIAVSTRAAETDPWSADDAVTLQAYNSGESAQSQTATYTYDGTSWNTITGLYWSSYLTGLDFLGYYPATATAEGLAFALPTDQTDAAKLHSADYMTTERKYSVSNTGANGTTVDFAFNHRLVKIIMNVTYSAEFEETKPTLTLERIFSQGSGVSVTVNADNSTQSTVTATGSTTLVQPLIGTNAEGRPCYTALVTPGTLTRGISALMTLAVNGELRQATYTGSLTALESGKAYSFNVKVGREKIEIADNGVTVVDWNNAGGEISGGEVEEMMMILNISGKNLSAMSDTEISNLIASKVNNGKLTITGSFGDTEEEAQANFATIAKYIREHKNVTALDFSETTGVTTIGKNVTDRNYNCSFYYSALVSVNLPASVTTLGTDAFNGCYTLTTVTGGGNALTLGENAFYNCFDLTTYPANLKKIGGTAFYQCTALTGEYNGTVTTELDDYAFYLSYFATIKCPNVTVLNLYSFSRCDNLKALYLTAETFSFVRCYKSSIGTGKVYDPFCGIVISQNGALYLNASQKENINKSGEWTPVAIKTDDNDTGLEQAINLGRYFKAVYCGTEQVYPAQ